MSDMRTILLRTLENLSVTELHTFKWLLQFTCFLKGLPQLHQHWYVQCYTDLVDDMVEMLGPHCEEVTREVFIDMDRTDLVHKLVESSSTLKGKLQNT